MILEGSKHRNLFQHTVLLIIHMSLYSRVPYENLMDQTYATKCGEVYVFPARTYFQR
jgi:hypothetical protein